MKITRKTFKINLILYFFIAIVLVFFMLGSIKSLRYNYKEGDIIENDIFTNRRILDEVETIRLKNEAASSVELIKTENPLVREKTFQNINKLFDEIVFYRSGGNPGLGRKIVEIRKEAKVVNLYDLSDEEIKVLLDLDSNRILSLKNNIETVIRNLYDEGIENKELSQYKEKAIQEFLKLETDDELIFFADKFFQKELKANLYDDLAKTKEVRDEKTDEVEDVYLEKGTLIAASGSILGEREILLLEKSGLMIDDGLDFNLYLGLFLFVLIITIIVLLYFLSNDNFIESKIFIPIGITVVLSALFYTFIINYNPYIIPVAFAVIIITIIGDYKIAIFINTFLVLYFSISNLFPKDLLVSSLVQGIFLATSLNGEKQRRDVLKLGFISGLISVLTILSMNLINSASIKDSIINYIIVFLSQGISSILALGAIPIAEFFFKILTSFKLLELSDTNNKLIKRLMQEAPGTYQHSIAVANLGEQAADAIGANSLLVRVMGYYHDIGKIKRPLLFSENQIGIDNPHDNMEPIKSASIILEHVKDGVQIAKEEKLPKEIIQGIQEHHGTTLVQYFYYLAKEDLSGIPISEEEFRYKGPKPQSKETVILMLADSCEAAVRSIKNINMESINDLVEKVIKSKADDNQFNSSNITFEEIEIIKKTFLNYFKTFYHDRIEYPKEVDDGDSISK